jgi:hypothetical protein
VFSTTNGAGLAGEFAQKIIGEPIKRSFVAYYIDSGAQKKALRKLFSGPSFGSCLLA